MKTSIRQGGAVLALTLGAVVAGCGIAELSIRIAARVSPAVNDLFVGTDPLAILIEPHGELGYRQRPGSVYHYADSTTATSNGRGYRGPVVASPKPTGTFRIVLFGGSTTHGWGVNDSSTIDAHMRDILRKEYSGRQIEVVNLGFDGYDSWQDFERLRSDGIPLKPDLVIFNVGINDVRNARYPHLVDRDPRTLLWSADLARLRKERDQGGPSAWTLTKHYLYVARLGGLIRDRMGSGGVSRGTTTVTAYPEAADYFQRNVERMVALTLSRGVPVLLSTPPSALKLPGNVYQTSGRTYWVGDAATTQQYREELDRRLRRVADSLSSTGQVRYVPHAMSVELFLDDCHLTSAGNRRMAEDFAVAAAPIIAGATASASTTR